jgi:hypothetical protein
MGWRSGIEPTIVIPRLGPDGLSRNDNGKLSRRIASPRHRGDRLCSARWRDEARASLRAQSAACAVPRADRGRFADGGAGDDIGRAGRRGQDRCRRNRGRGSRGARHCVGGGKNLSLHRSDDAGGSRADGRDQRLARISAAGNDFVRPGALAPSHAGRVEAGAGFLGGGIIVFGRIAMGERFAAGLLHEVWEVIGMAGSSGAMRCMSPNSQGGDVASIIATPRASTAPTPARH